MQIPKVLVTYKRFITYSLVAITTIGTIFGGSLWLYKEVAWKSDIKRVESQLITQFERKTDIGLLEILKIRLASVKSDFDIYDGAIRTYESKESLNRDERRNKEIFEENRRESEIEMKSLERRIEYLERKVDGVR